MPCEKDWTIFGGVISERIGQDCKKGHFFHVFTGGKGEKRRRGEERRERRKKRRKEKKKVRKEEKKRKEDQRRKKKRRREKKGGRSGRRSVMDVQVLSVTFFLKQLMLKQKSHDTEGKKSEKRNKEERGLGGEGGEGEECTMISPSNSGYVSAGDTSSVTGVKGLDLPDT